MLVRLSHSPIRSRMERARTPQHKPILRRLYRQVADSGAGGSPQIQYLESTLKEMACPSLFRMRRRAWSGMGPRGGSVLDALSYTGTASGVSSPAAQHPSPEYEDAGAISPGHRGLPSFFGAELQLLSQEVVVSLTCLRPSGPSSSQLLFSHPFPLPAGRSPQAVVMVR